MTITGLENNYYLINNSINLLINGFASTVSYLEIKATNSNTTKVAEIRIYPISGTFKIDISHLVKSTFNQPSYPNVNLNLNSISLDFKAYFVNNTNSTTTITKFFIRGGNHQGIYPNCIREKENYLLNGDVISNLITSKMPCWRCDLEDFSSLITQQSPKINGAVYDLITTDTECFDKPCKGIRVIFLNQYGTYSGWYFNNYEVADSTKHVDFIQQFGTAFNGNNFNDLGSKVTTTLTVKDSVPVAYNNLIRQLIISIEVYVIENGFFRKVILNNSKWNFNSRENTYKHSITFDYLEVLNPSDIC